MSPQRFEGVTIEFAADYDLVSAALAMLAHGLCELPPDEREAKLEAFENGRLFAPLLIMSPRSSVSALSALPPNPEPPLREISSCRSVSVIETQSSFSMIQLV